MRLYFLEYFSDFILFAWGKIVKCESTKVVVQVYFRTELYCFECVLLLTSSLLSNAEVVSVFFSVMEKAQNKSVLLRLRRRVDPIFYKKIILQIC